MSVRCAVVFCDWALKKIAAFLADCCWSARVPQNAHWKNSGWSSRTRPLGLNVISALLNYFQPPWWALWILAISRWAFGACGQFGLSSASKLLSALFEKILDCLALMIEKFISWLLEAQCSTLAASFIESRGVQYLHIWFRETWLCFANRTESCSAQVFKVSLEDAPEKKRALVAKVIWVCGVSECVCPPRRRRCVPFDKPIFRAPIFARNSFYCSCLAERYLGICDLPM